MVSLSGGGTLASPARRRSCLKSLCFSIDGLCLIHGHLWERLAHQCPSAPPRESGKKTLSGQKSELKCSKNLESSFSIIAVANSDMHQTPSDYPPIDSRFPRHPSRLLRRFSSSAASLLPVISSFISHLLRGNKRKRKRLSG